MSLIITKEFTWEMGHRVPNHNSKCRNLHGHHYRLIVSVGGNINKTNGDSSEGMIVDFGDLKKIVKQEIVEYFDHSFVYWEKDEIILKFSNENLDLLMIKINSVPTAENLVNLIAEKLQNKIASIGEKTYLSRLELFETPTSSAIWSLEK